MNVEWINNAIFTLAALFLILGVGVLIVRGMMGRTNVDTLYGVGRQKSRQVQFQESMTGFMLLLFGFVLLGLWYLLSSRTWVSIPTGAGEPLAPATAVVTVAPTDVPVTVTISAEELDAADVATEDPMPSDVDGGEPEPTTVIVPTETPTLLVEASPTVSAEPTRIPTGARINATYLNLRTEPNGPILALLRQEDDPFLDVLDGYIRRDGFYWRKVGLEDGSAGWVAEEYITYLYENSDE